MFENMRGRSISLSSPAIALSIVEHRIRALVRPFSLSLLRVSMAVVFIWFGALKLADATPVADLIAGTVPWLDRSWFVPFLGGVEVALGVGLLVGRWLTTISTVLVAHLTGTFLVLVMEPQLAFRHANPFLLTTVGEFVVKNVVLISAALVLASQLRDTQPKAAGLPVGRADEHAPTTAQLPSQRSAPAPAPAAT